MKPVQLSLAVALMLAAMPLAAFAQEATEEEASSPWSWSAAATSDYVWRGVSQTDEDPAFQTGLTYTSPVGVYAGVWASNVDFGAGDPDFEVDGYIGYNVDFGDNVNFDIMYNEYSYPGASELNFGELITKTTFFEDYSFTLAYTNDFGGTDDTGIYYALGGSWSLPADFGLDVSVGRSTFGDDVGLEDYTDYSVSLSRSFGPASVSLGYYDTNSAGFENFDYLADSRVVLTISVEAP